MLKTHRLYDVHTSCILKSCSLLNPRCRDIRTQKNQSGKLSKSWQIRLRPILVSAITLPIAVPTCVLIESICVQLARGSPEYWEISIKTDAGTVVEFQLLLFPASCSFVRCKGNWLAAVPYQVLWQYHEGEFRLSSPQRILSENSWKYQHGFHRALGIYPLSV